jgi:hypothetical protein
MRTLVLPLREITVSLAFYDLSFLVFYALYRGNGEWPLDILIGTSLGPSPTIHPKALSDGIGEAFQKSYLLISECCGLHKSKIS